MKSGPERSIGESLLTARPPNLNLVGNVPLGLEVNSQSACIEHRVLGPDDAAVWDRRVFAHCDYHFFHSAAWARVICETYGHTPHYLVLSQPNGEPAALLPMIEVKSRLTGRRGVCLPFSDFCEPLVFIENQRTLIEAELFRLARELRWNYIELRGANPLELTCGPAVTYYGHKLDLLEPADAMLDRFSDGTKGAVRRALKSEMQALTLDSEQAVRDFFRLHVRTRRRHGVPPQPWKFFANIYRHVVKPGLGFVVLVRSGARIVAGAMFFVFGGRAVYKFAASDPAYAQSRANNLVLWHAIQHLIGMGARVLHFGRTALTNEGLRRFKLSWGSAEEIIRYDRLDAETGTWSSNCREREGGWAAHFIRHSPLLFNQALGAAIYPHLD